MEGDFSREVLAPEIIYTRRNTDPNPLEVVEYPKRILIRRNSKFDKGIFHFQLSLYLPAKCTKNIDDIIFGQKFGQTLFRSKSSSELSQVIFDPKRLISSKFAPQPSHPSSISVFFQTQATQGIHIPIIYSPTFVVATPFVYVPSLSVSSIFTHSLIVPNPPRFMASRFTPVAI